MGEYAKRRSDGVEIKIGTCEDMYYLRYEDRSKVEPINGNLDPSSSERLVLRYRLPFPDEDNLQLGEYKDYQRGQLLYRSTRFGSEYFVDESKASEPGSIQLAHQPSGLLLSVPCYHGIRLPKLEGEVISVGWNGKGPAFELRQIGPRLDSNVVERLFPIVYCRFCRMLWRYDWPEIWEYVPLDLRVVLREYANAAFTVKAEAMQT